MPTAQTRRSRQRRLQTLEKLEDRSLLAANIFVATTGNDTSGTGSLTAPYATLARAISAAVAGDTVTLRGGTYAGGVRIDLPNITIQSQPGEWAIVAAPMTVQNIESTIRFNPDASGGRLSRLEITGGYYYGVMLQTTWDWGPTVRKYGASHITIEDCRIHDTGRDCIKLTPLCNDVTIQRNEIYRSGRRDPSNAEGIDDVNANRLVVQDCNIHDIPTNGLYAKGGAAGCIIQRNVITNCGGGGIMVGFYTDEEYFSTDTNPDYYENVDGIVRNNIIVNTQMAGIGLYASLRAQVFNNTLVNVAQTAQAAILLNSGEIYFDTNPIPLVVPNRSPSLQNNIVVQSATSSRTMFQIRSSGLTGALTVNHNRYYHVGTTAVFEDDRDGNGFTGNLAQWRTHISDDTGSSEGNPLLDANQRLTASSPCIDAGIALAAVTNDIDRDARTGLYDIGADESAGQSAKSSLQFSSARYSVGEAAGSVVIAVTRTGNTRTVATVRYATRNGTATAGFDYVSTTGTLSFAVGETNKTFRIPIINDSQHEAGETLLLALSGPTGGAVSGSPSTAVVTIVDNDPVLTLPALSFANVSSSGSEQVSPQFEVRLSKPSTRAVTVNYYVVAGTAAARLDYTPVSGTLTFQPGQTHQRLVVPVINDTLEEKNETFTVRLSSPTNAALSNGNLHTYTIVDNDRAPVVASGHLTYRGSNGHVFRVAVTEGAVPEDLTVRLNALSPGSNDRSISLSPNGEWMAVETDRFGIGAWTGLALVRPNLSSGEAVRVNGDFVHPEGKTAVASDGNLVVYSTGGGPHTRDLWAIRRTGNVWSRPLLLTAASPFAFNAEPSIAADGRTVLFDAGNQPYAGRGTAIAEVHTDASGLRVVLTAADGPAGLPRSGALHSASYAPDHSIVFEADWNGERVWRLRPGETIPVQVGNFNNDNSPVVLPDGRIVTLWLERAGGSGNHELKVMAADGRNFFMLLTGQDILDTGLGSGL